MQTIFVAPNSDAGPNEYVPSPSGAHYLNVRENPHDADSSYLNLTTGRNEAFGLDVSAIPDGSQIVAVRVQMAFRGTSTGASSCRMGFNLAGLDYFGPEHQEVEDQGYHVYVDDLTGIAAWTKQLLATALLRHQSVTQPADIPRPRLSQLVIFVDLVPPPARPEALAGAVSDSAGISAPIVNSGDASFVVGSNTASAIAPEAPPLIKDKRTGDPIAVGPTGFPASLHPSAIPSET